jgi:hypothetical protein
MPIEGLLGRKLGMTQVFDSTGKIHAVTVVEAGPMVVTQVKTSSKDGYDAVQVGYGEKKKINKPMRGHLKGSGANARLVREFRSPAASEYSVGDKIGIELFTEGDLVRHRRHADAGSRVACAGTTSVADRRRTASRTATALRLVGSGTRRAACSRARRCRGTWAPYR